MKKKFRVVIFMLVFMFIGVINGNAENVVNENIVAAYEYNDTSCITGEESTCVKTDCYKKLEENSCKAGTIIKYKVNDTDTKPFYVLYGDSNTMTLFEATTAISGSWLKYEISDIGAPIFSLSDGPNQALELLENYTKNWKNVNDITYQMGVTEFFGNAYTGGCDDNKGCTKNIYSWSSPITVKARMITIQEATHLGCKLSQSNSCPKFLTNGIKNIGIYTMNDSKFMHRNGTDENWIAGDMPAQERDIRAVVVVNKTKSIDESTAANPTDTNNKENQTVKVADTLKTAYIGYCIGIIVLIVGIAVLVQFYRKNKINNSEK